MTTWQYVAIAELLLLVAAAVVWVRMKGAERD
jgi:hypothetical protein